MKHAIALICLLVIGCRAPGSPAPPAPAANPLDIIFPYQWKGIIDKNAVEEPSGAVFHRQRGTLFIIGDEGSLYELTPAGEMKNSKVIEEGADFEGVTCDPTTGLLYAVIEDAEQIVEVDPDTMTIGRRFNIERTYEGRLVMKQGGNGVEGITFIPDAAHPQGGVFYVVNQTFVLDDPEDVSALVQVVLPLRTGVGDTFTVPIARHMPLNIIDLAGLHYDATTGHIFAVSDSDNVLLELTTDGDIVRSWAFPGDNQEGIAADNDGSMYIAQDTGGVLRIKWKR
jgi:uncharacterized protein YjiK